VAVRIFPVTRDEGDLGGMEEQRPAELRFPGLFPQVRENPLSLQKNGSRDDAQEFHWFSFKLPAEPHYFSDDQASAYSRFAARCQK
jgi:hypothetical protein